MQLFLSVFLLMLVLTALTRAPCREPPEELVAGLTVCGTGWCPESPWSLEDGLAG